MDAAGSPVEIGVTAAPAYCAAPPRMPTTRSPDTTAAAVTSPPGFASRAQAPEERFATPRPAAHTAVPSVARREGKRSPPGRVSARHVPSAPRFHTFSPSAAYTASATAIDEIVRAESPSRVHVPASRRHTPRGVAAQSVAPLPASAVASAPGSEFTGTKTRPALTGRAARRTVSSATDMARAGKPRTSESRLMWRASGAGSAFFAVYMARHVRNTRWGMEFQKEKS